MGSEMVIENTLPLTRTENTYLKKLAQFEKLSPSPVLTEEPTVWSVCVSGLPDLLPEGTIINVKVEIVTPN